MTAADLSRLLGADRSLGPKILRGERRLPVDHIRILARHFQIEPGLFLCPSLLVRPHRKAISGSVVTTLHLMAD